MIIFASLVIAVLAGYVILSAIVPLSASVVTKLVLSVVAAVICGKYFIFCLFGGTLSMPWLSRGAQIVYEVCFGAVLCFVFFLLLVDVISITLWLIEKVSGTELPSIKNNWSIGLLFVISLVLSIYGCYEALRVPDVRAETISVKNLPSQLKGLKIALLGDLHVGPIQGREWVTEIVDKTNALNPDIILMVGDYVDGPVEKVLPELEPLKTLKAQYGVIAVTGNHEYFSGYTQWMNALRTLGITVLENQHVVIDKDGTKLVIGGTTDLVAGRLGLPMPDVPKTFEGAPSDTLRIVLCHQPKSTMGEEQYFDLQLSGHTHGGHTFFLYPLVYLFNNGLVGGAYEREEASYYVTRGSGLWNGYSQRIGVQSEITLLTLE